MDCFLLRVTSICGPDDQASADWICFDSGTESCPGHLPLMASGSSDSRSSNTSLNEDLVIYPNPGRNHINLKGDAVRKGNKVLIYDSRGVLVSSQSFLSDHSVLIDISRMSPSTYSVIIESVEKEVLSKSQFIKL